MSLPEPDETLLRRWNMLENLDVLPGGHCARVYASGERVAKVPFRGEEQTTGFFAARRLANFGGPEIFDFDEPTGSLLMQRIRPGKKLADQTMTFDSMREIFVHHFLGMRKIPCDGLMPLPGYWENSDEAEGLNASAPLKGFIHGDLHHENLLLGPTGYVAIDPKGLVGDIHYETIAWLRNPIPRLAQIEDLTSHLEREITELSHELDLDPERIIDWGVIDSDGDSDPSHPWARLPEAYRNLQKGSRR